MNDEKEIEQFSPFHTRRDFKFIWQYFSSETEKAAKEKKNEKSLFAAVIIENRQIMILHMLRNYASTLLFAPLVIEQKKFESINKERQDIQF